MKILKNIFFNRLYKKRTQKLCSFFMSNSLEFDYNVTIVTIINNHKQNINGDDGGNAREKLGF